MKLELKFQISTRAKSPLMELVIIEEELWVFLDLCRHDICFNSSYWVLLPTCPASDQHLWVWSALIMIRKIPT